MHLLKMVKPIYVVFFVLILLIFGTALAFSYCNGVVDSKVEYSADTTTVTSAVTVSAFDSEFTSSSARIDESYFFVDKGSLFASSKKNGKALIASDVLEINGINDKWIYVTTASTDTLKSYLVRLSFDGKTREVIIMGVESGSIYNNKMDIVYFTNSKNKPILVNSLKLIAKERRMIFRDYGIRIAGTLVFAYDMTSEMVNDKVVLKLFYKSGTNKNYYRRLVLNDTGTVFSDKTSID